MIGTSQRAGQHELQAGHPARRVQIDILGGTIVGEQAEPSQAG